MDKGILIDVVKREVYEVELTTNLVSFYKLIGCRSVDRVVLNDRNDVWVDDEGLFLDPMPGMFYIAGYPRPLAGNGLVLGYTDEGESCSTTLTVERLKGLIRFVNVN